MHRPVAALLILLSATFCASASEFDWMVREFSRQTGCRQTHIPFFGLARLAVAIGHPAGATGLRLALFENTSLPAERFSTLMDATAGTAWKPMVRVRSKHESTNVYVQELPNKLRLLIGTADGNETTLVELQIRPEKMIDFVDHYRHQNRSKHPAPVEF